MPRIIVTDGYTLNPGDLSWDGFAVLGDLTVYDRTAPEDLAARIGDAEIVLANKAVISREIIDQCPNLRYVGVLATGYNTVDTTAAAQHGITVTNIPAYSTPSVVQMVFALLLEICQHVGEHSRAVHEGEWSNCPDFCFWNTPLTELSGKTMGIIGFGAIGQSVARIAVAFGMKVLAYGPHYKPEMDQNGCSAATLDDLLANADIVSLNCPLFPETRGIICRENIRKMKKGVILINTARGACLVEEDVAKALKSGHIAALGADVVSLEPIHPDNPLLHAPNAIITPHIAWAPRESRSRLMETAVANLTAYLQGRPQNKVN